MNAADLEDTSNNVGSGTASVNWSVSADTLSVSAQPPAGVLAGSGFGLTVQVLNAQSQLDTNFSGMLTVSLGNNPGNSTLGGTLMVPVVNGVATFTGLTVSNPGLAYTLQIAGSGLATITTAPFDVAGYKLVANGGLMDLDWFGTNLGDAVLFTQMGNSTVVISTMEVGGIAVSNTATVTGVTGRIVADSYNGNDTVSGSGLKTISSSITAGNGNDLLIGGNGGANTIVAGNGNNMIYGNLMVGNLGTVGGNNTITVGDGNNTIYGNDGVDGGEGGNNTITAGNGNNVIYGNQGRNSPLIISRATTRSRSATARTRSTATTATTAAKGATTPSSPAAATT